VPGCIECGEVLRALLLVIVLSTGAGPADARSLKVTGTAGLLSEWEFNGDVTETLAGGIKQFSGPLNWKHVGLCSPNGPEEKSGQIQFQVSESRASSKIDVTLRLEGAQCTYNGILSVALLDSWTART
jgi:hypothetical protein